MKLPVGTIIKLIAGISFLAYFLFPGNGFDMPSFWIWILTGVNVLLSMIFLFFLRKKPKAMSREGVVEWLSTSIFVGAIAFVIFFSLHLTILPVETVEAACVVDFLVLGYMILVFRKSKLWVRGRQLPTQ